MRKSDARHLLVLVSMGLLLGPLLAPADATDRTVVASAGLLAGVFLLAGSLASCVRIYRQDRRKR